MFDPESYPDEANSNANEDRKELRRLSSQVAILADLLERRSIISICRSCHEIYSTCVFCEKCGEQASLGLNDDWTQKESK